MKLTEKEMEVLDWLRELQNKTEGDIMLKYINDFWRVCPVIVSKDRKSGLVQLEKVNLKVWKSLIKKGYFKREYFEKDSTEYYYIFIK